MKKGADNKRKASIAAIADKTAEAERLITIKTIIEAVFHIARSRVSNQITVRSFIEDMSDSEVHGAEYRKSADTWMSWFYYKRAPKSLTVDALKETIITSIKALAEREAVDKLSGFNAALLAVELYSYMKNNAYVNGCISYNMHEDLKQYWENEQLISDHKEAEIFVKKLLRIALFNTNNLLDRAAEEQKRAMTTSALPAGHIDAVKNTTTATLSRQYGDISVTVSNGDAANGVGILGCNTAVSILCRQIMLYYPERKLDESKIIEELDKSYDYICGMESSTVFAIYERAVAGARENVLRLVGASCILPYDEYLRKQGVVDRDELRHDFISSVLCEPNTARREFRGWLDSTVSGRGFSVDSSRLLRLYLSFVVMLCGRDNEQGEPEQLLTERARLSIHNMNLSEPAAIQVAAWYKHIMNNRQGGLDAVGTESLSRAAEDLESEINHEFTWEGAAHGTPNGIYHTTGFLWMLWAVLDSARRVPIEYSAIDGMAVDSLSGNAYSTYLERLRDRLHEMSGTIRPYYGSSDAGDTSQRKPDDMHSLYIQQSYASAEESENENGVRSSRSYDTIFDAFPSDIDEPVRLIVVKKSGWGKTSLIKMLACNYAFERDNEWVLSRLDRYYAPEGTADAEASSIARRANAVRSYAPIVISVRDIANIYSDYESSIAFTNLYLTMAVRAVCDGMAVNEFERLFRGIADIVMNKPEGQSPRYPLLLIDGVDEFVPITAGSRVSGREMTARFLSYLKEFLDNHPFCSCIITASESPEHPIEKDFSTVMPLSFTKLQSVDYCEKWFVMKGSTKDEGRLFAERLMSSYSIRRMARRPEFFNYMIAVATMGGGMSLGTALYESPFSLLSKLTGSAGLFIRQPNGSDLSRISSREIRLPLAYLAKSMQDSCKDELAIDSVHIPVSDLLKLIERTQEAFKDYITSRSLFGENNEPRDIVDRLRSFSFLKFDRTTGREEDDLFSFSSRPLMWYFAALGICIDDILQEYKDPKGSAALNYIKSNMDTRCSHAHIKYRDDWIYIIAYTVMHAGINGTQIVDYLCGCTVNSSSKNRECRWVCVQTLGKIVAMYPFCTQTIRQRMYRATFMRYFFNFQIEDVWAILRSPAQEEFLEYTYKEFVNSIGSSFPRFCWLIGWLEWTVRTTVLEKKNDRSPIALDTVAPPEFAERLNSSYDPQHKETLIMELIEYIDEQLDGGVTGGIEPMRALLMISNFFWLCEYNDRSYRIARLDDQPTIEDYIHLSVGQMERCAEVLYRLIRLGSTGMAAFASYTLSHIYHRGGASRRAIERLLCNQEGLLALITADYKARIDCRRETKLLCDDSIYEHDRSEHPIEGAITILNLLDPSKLTGDNGLICIEDKSEPTEEMRSFYAAEWDKLIKLDDQGKRNRYLLLRLCVILNVWDKKALAEKAKVLNLEYQEARRRDYPVLLNKDDGERLLGWVERLAGEDEN